MTTGYGYDEGDMIIQQIKEMTQETDDAGVIHNLNFDTHDGVNMSLRSSVYKDKDSIGGDLDL